MKDYLINVDDYLVLTSDNAIKRLEDNLEEVSLDLIEEFEMSNDFLDLENDFLNNIGNNIFPKILFVNKKVLH